MAKGKQGSSGTKVVETKGQCFVRVVTPRVQKAIKMILLIGNCAGSVYSYDEVQAKQITDALYKAVNDVEERFQRKKGVEKMVFHFKS